MPVLRCHHCHTSWNVDPPVPRATECPSCRRDARVCLNCAFYDVGAARSCREEQAEWVKEKERANFCSYFTPGAGLAASQADAAKAKLDALFGARPSPDNLSERKGGGLAADLAKFLKDKA